MRGLPKEYDQKIEELFPLGKKKIMKLCKEQDMKIQKNFHDRQAFYIKKMNNHYKILQNNNRKDFIENRIGFQNLKQHVLLKA